ncbi:hypothetical protein PYCCODRAFT_18642 [Trametes coccinea BRFM310]|uniref:Uncharacterized protein n=1 Tax=Trametes coccinea (strain BRFM310) TaxID=1353009 RepID=A0A1Y2J4V1_TRAC3|nr:hypothetical protein PYCCODRAFT_18642 [Trametes coccinea BRFM310]
MHISPGQCSPTTASAQRQERMTSRTLYTATWLSLSTEHAIGARGMVDMAVDEWTTDGPILRGPWALRHALQRAIPCHLAGYMAQLGWTIRDAARMSGERACHQRPVCGRTWVVTSQTSSHGVIPKMACFAWNAPIWRTMRRAWLARLVGRTV